MDKFTDEQLAYINNTDKTDTKLIACAGSGKTRCIIFKMHNLIKKKIFKSSEVLMLTFSRFTRDDFLNKIRSLKIKTIDVDNNIKTIDSFAKLLIDENNEIDVSLLSFKLMEYLEHVSIEEILSHPRLSKIKIIFIDEAQDLNETQYKILMYLKQKNNSLINMIGDPNQNIYQFRHSLDKYLMDFEANVFNLTKNFRSHDEIINFSKHLRPIKTLDVKGVKGNIGAKPLILFHEDDNDFKLNLVKIFTDAKDAGIDLSEFAILAPTRGRMKGFGKSNGLCLVTNILCENNIKFEQFYEEATDETGTNITYCPKKGHVNVLTCMGSKGLEWNYVILIDADMCLINKRQFDIEKHKHDQYLLYVACSRAIKNMIIFSKFDRNETNPQFKLNPWFSEIPKQYYILDNKYKIPFKYPKIKNVNYGEGEKIITKLLDRLTEEKLNKLYSICGYSQDTDAKQITQIYDTDFSKTLNSSILLGKYVENLFNIRYMLNKGLPKKRFPDIENIIDSKHMITNVHFMVNDWYYANRDHFTWEKFENEKHLLDANLVSTIESKFDKNHDFDKHTIVTEGYYKYYVISSRETLKANYEKYLKTKNMKMLRTYLFNIIVFKYSIETQHYFHIKMKGKKFRNMLTDCSELFDQIENFAESTNLNFTDFNVHVENSTNKGEIDALEEVDGIKYIWEFKCTSEISLKHVLQVMMYNILYNKLDCLEENETYNLVINFINFLKGEVINVKIQLDHDKVATILQLIL